MLVELAVENFAVIESARVRFHSGLNLLTGETGSGKSLVVDAVALLLGGRAAGEMIRTGADKARISGIFEVDSSAELLAILEPAGIEIEDGELLVERELQASGQGSASPGAKGGTGAAAGGSAGGSSAGGVKSRAFVNNRPATAALLRDLSPFLADIHGQHDQQQLFSPQVQLAMLDAFALAEPARPGTAYQSQTLVSRVRETYRRWRQVAAELEELDEGAREKLRLVDLWSFQKNEIEAVAPTAGEDAALDRERSLLRNVVRLGEIAGSAYETLQESQDSISGQVAAVAKALDELARIDPATREIHATLEPARIAIDEAAHALRTYLGRLEADPARLDEVEARLAELEKLKRKYGASLDEVMTFLDRTRRELAAVENSTERRNALEREQKELAGLYESAAAELSKTRKDASAKLARRVETELAALAMERTRVVIRVEPAEWSERGADRAEFLLAPNPGEEPKPLEKIASGGELSRVALALKTCTTGPIRRESVPRTLVFDEVDAGVGGGAAESVGRRLKKLSGSGQVLCVTHLPQIAGFADHHYFVAKQTKSGRTIATVEELSAADRAGEIGRMLSGERVTPEALRHAKQLIKLAAE